MAEQESIEHASEHFDYVIKDEFRDDLLTHGGHEATLLSNIHQGLFCVSKLADIQQAFASAREFYSDGTADKSAVLSPNGEHSLNVAISMLSAYMADDLSTYIRRLVRKGGVPQ